MKMLKVMALLSLLMLVVSCGGSKGATGAAKKYIIATDATYAPFEFQENGKYIGIDVDLITGIKENNIYRLKEFRSYWDSLCCNKTPSDNRTIFTVLFNNIAIGVFDKQFWRMDY